MANEKSGFNFAQYDQSNVRDRVDVANQDYR
jgi:hypothetical protein